MEGRLGILIVEDDLIQSLLLEKVVQSLNHCVLGTTIYGERAVDLVDELSPDIIFMDIALAGAISGMESAQMINAKSKTAIFYVTGNSWVKDEERLKSSRFEDILIKPISKVDVQEAILTYITKPHQ